MESRRVVAAELTVTGTDADPGADPGADTDTGTDPVFEDQVTRGAARDGQHSDWGGARVKICNWRARRPGPPSRARPCPLFASLLKAPPVDRLLIARGWRAERGGVGQHSDGEEPA